jgi:RNA polymerase sigma-70 factor (ECF subfamily)
MGTATESRASRQALREDVARALQADLRQFFVERTRDTAQSDDLAQEAMARVIAGLRSFRGEASLRTWARKIALHLWRDEARRPASRVVTPVGDSDALSVLAWLDADDRDTDPAPDAMSDRRTTRICLLHAIDRLPPSERTAVLLHELGDLSLERTARRLGCSVGAVKVRLHRGRRRLAELCRAECMEDVGPRGDRICAPKPCGDGPRSQEEARD